MQTISLFVRAHDLRFVCTVFCNQGTRSTGATTKFNQINYDLIAIAIEMVIVITNVITEEIEKPNELEKRISVIHCLFCITETKFLVAQVAIVSSFR